MSWITENPTWLLALGVVVEGILAVMLVRSGRAILIGAMAVVAALVLAGIVTERVIVTPREEVENTLDEAAAAVAANDLPGVLKFLAGDAAELRSMAESNMPHLRFTEAKIRDLNVTINRYVTPHTAQVRFLGVMSVDDARAPQFPREHYLERFTVGLRRDGDRWLLTRLESRPVEESLPWQSQAARR